MAALAVTCRSVCYVAQWALATGAPDVEHKTRVAKAYVSRAVREVAESGIQVHGGVGFTEEHDLHLLVKHALTLEAAWGDPGEHEDALADALSARAADRVGSRT
jgi:alkylation response protein AidB-like acyl-CoA dehydrogenase